jgi:hypothetical protein
VSTKAKKKATTPPTPVLAAFVEPVALGATIAASGPPTVTLAYWKGLVTTLAIKPLAREVAVLPLPRLMPLHEAFTLASARLGSYSLAADDLAQRARARQLLVVAQVIGRDGSKRVFLLRSKFWRWFRVVWSSPRPDEGRPDPGVGVDIRTLGRWHFFVGRRRLDALYSVVPLSKSVIKSDDTKRYSMPPPGRSRIRKAIQDFTLKRYGAGWTSVTTAVIRKAAGEDKDFMKLGPLADRTTFAFALGRKKDRKKD